MGMASVSWFYLFNIQVRANCTTACNIQAALQYVELTHVSSSVSFFFLYLFRFTKMCMQLGTGSEVMLAPLPGGRGLRAEQRMSIGGCWCPDGSVWSVTFTFTETHEGKLWASLPFRSFVCFLDKELNGTSDGIVSFFFFFFFFFLTTRLFFFKKLDFLL